MEQAVRIETVRLLLRTMQVEDIDPLLGIFADPQVMASFDESPFGRTQMAWWVQRNLDHQTAHGYGLFSVILKSSGVLIGNCGLEHMDVEGVPAAELGYDFRSDHWNQGYATEAARAVRDYAFHTLNLTRLVSLIRIGNHASRRVAEKTGLHCASEIARYEHRYWQYVVEREATNEKT